MSALKEVSHRGCSGRLLHGGLREPVSKFRQHLLANARTLLYVIIETCSSEGRDSAAKDVLRAKIPAEK